MTDQGFGLPAPLPAV